MVVCFLALFLQLNNVQVKNATEYANDPANPSVVAAKYDQPRGIIQSADGVVLAQSVRTHGGSYKYVRQYPLGTLFGQITGYLSFSAAPPASRTPTTRILAQHNRPVKTIGDLLTTPTETDTVTLTLSSKLQKTARQALDGRDGAIVVLDPTTGAVLAMYSNPTFDPNPLAANDATTVSRRLQGRQHQEPHHRLPPRGVPRLPGHLPARVDVQGRHGDGRVPVRPQAGEHPHAVLQLHPLQLLRGPDHSLCATTAGARAGGPSPRCCRRRVTPASPSSAPRWVRSSMQAEAQSFGFNQQPPLDLPHSPFEVSQFLQPGCWAEPRSSWPTRRSARTARSPRPCRWRWWRPGSPTGAW